jgi:ligand-binding SRPBCC domain-containing protein
LSGGSFTEESWLPAPPGRVWDRITTPAGINDEFRPLLRMTFPARVEQLDPNSVAVGERICRSWILLLGVLPIDYDDIVLVSLDPGRGFHERSSMGSQRVWEHERTLAPDGDGCRVTDRVSFETRIPGTAGLTRAIAGRVFRHRHRRLRRAFGQSDPAGRI